MEDHEVDQPDPKAPPEEGQEQKPHREGRPKGGSRLHLKKLTEEMQRKRHTKEDGDAKAVPPTLTALDRKSSEPILKSQVVPKWLQEESKKKKHGELKKSVSDNEGLTRASVAAASFAAKKLMVERLQLGEKAPPALVLAEENVGADERLLRDSETEAEIVEDETAKIEEEIRRLEEEIEEEENDDGPIEDDDI